MEGIILINKEKDYTSHDVVAIVKKMFNEKVGHTGTLDPNATGVLPLLIGKGTKLSKYLIEHDKTYKAVLKLGIKTDTADITGNVLNTVNYSEKLTNKHIQEVLCGIKGKQKQYPPMYSAIKVNGKKLYEYARQNKQIEVPLREIEIYDIQLNDYNFKENEIIFTIDCSKGTYIRTICEQIAEKLDTIGCMKELQRLRVGKFKIEDAVTIQELKDNMSNASYIEKHLISFENIFKNNKKIILDNKKMMLFFNGVKLNYKLDDDIYRIYDEKMKFIGIGIIKDNFLKRDIIL